MNATGIIVEYNPFHNGHLYQLKKVKEMYPNNVIIVVMSGNFTQRGDASIIDKWKKTDIALHYGIDLVVELPFHYATQSADIFSKGAIEIMKELKVENIVFGSESNDIDKLYKIANDILDNNSKVKKILDSGENYPTAISKSFDFNINTPNDILGICYIKEIIRQKANIRPITIQRTNNYHSTTIERIGSATSIRMGLRNKLNIKNSVPSYTYKYLKKDLFFIDDYFNLLKYKILSTDDLSIYQTVDEGIENRIKKYILESNSLEELINKIKTKRYTYNKIKRMLLHILVGFTKEEALKYKDINYIRVLGYSTKGKDYLNKIKKDVNIPIITNFNKYKDLLKLEYKSTTVYSSIVNNQLELIKNEFNIPKYKNGNN